MGSKGSNTTTSNQTQSYTANPVIGDAATKAIGMASDASDQPFQLPQAPVAGFNPFQQQAFNQVQGMQGMSQPYFDLGQQYIQQSADPITGADVNQYYNPMADNVTRQMQNIFGQQNRMTTGNLTQAAGGVGADRIAVGQANLANQQGLAAGQTYAGLYQQALQAAQQNKQMKAGAGYGIAQMGPAAQNAALQGTQALGAAGGLQQQQEQAQLNAPYQNQLAKIAFPYQQAQYLAGITGGLAPALGGTTTGHTETTQPSPSPWAQALGVGTSLLGTALGGPMGGMLGSSIGKGAGSAMGGFSGGGMGTYGGTGLPGYGGLYKRGGAVNPFDIGQGFDDGGAVDDGESWTPEPEFADESAGLNLAGRLPPQPSWGEMARRAGGYYSNMVPDALKTAGSNLIAGPYGERTPIFPSLKAAGQPPPPPSTNEPEAISTPTGVGGVGGIGSDRSNIPWGSPQPPVSGIPLPPSRPTARPTASAMPPRPTGQAFPSPAGGRPLMNADMSMDMPRERMPYPDATERDWGQKMARSPWMALVKAGARMAQTRGPIGSVIGAGFEAGASSLDEQRKSLQSEEGINQRAQQLYQQAKTHLDKYQRKTPHEVAQEALRAKSIASTTALQKNAEWLVRNGIAPDLNAAYQMAHSGVNQGAVYARLVAAEKKRLSTTQEGANMTEPQLEAEATRQVMGRLNANKPGAGAAGATATPSAPKATPTDKDREIGKSSPELRQKFINKFGIEP